MNISPPPFVSHFRDKKEETAFLFKLFICLTAGSDLTWGLGLFTAAVRSPSRKSTVVNNNVVFCALWITAAVHLNWASINLPLGKVDACFSKCKTIPLEIMKFKAHFLNNWQYVIRSYLICLSRKTSLFPKINRQFYEKLNIHFRIFTCRIFSFLKKPLLATWQWPPHGLFTFYYSLWKIFVHDLSLHLLLLFQIVIALTLYHRARSLSLSLSFRYIYYFGGLLSGGIKMNSSPLFLHQVLIPSLPNFQGEGGGIV